MANPDLDNPNPNRQVFVVLEGGIIHGVHTDVDDLEVIIIDRDIEDIGESDVFDIDGTDAYTYFVEVVGHPTDDQRRAYRRLTDLEETATKWGGSSDE